MNFCENYQEIISTIVFGITPKSCTTCKFSLVIEENDEVCGTCRDFSNYKSRL